ncbi:hypothetical protein PR048_029032 [Dryococelus australis]|uniref:Uncharacterized protein n=1 Tax=Dryococelus australis TaxID=614101 RepID=A0ABQ9GCA4_9NEOP|nr:hypothetical protein PR048_029032 [Dryococelus australis]
MFSGCTIFVHIRDRSGVVVRLLASHLGKPGSIPGGVTPAHADVVADDAAGRRVTTGIPPPQPCIPALLHAHLASPSSALKTSMLYQNMNVKLRKLVFRVLCVPETTSESKSENGTDFAELIRPTNPPYPTSLPLLPPSISVESLAKLLPPALCLSCPFFTSCFCNLRATSGLEGSFRRFVAAPTRQEQTEVRIPSTTRETRLSTTTG